MNGANTDGKNYEPDVTSYDYNAPLDESGRPTQKYSLLRDVIANATGVAPPAVPPVAHAMKIPAFPMKESVSLWQALPSPTHSEQILSMEDLDQAYGYILYRKKVDGPAEGPLVLDQLHDYAQIFLDGKLLGALDRRLAQNQLALKVPAGGGQLDILVENTGRINFNIVLRGERKGITKQVTLGGKPLLGWDIYPLPMTIPEKLPFTSTPCSGPCFYRGSFDVTAPSDTFLDTSAFTKGAVWLNGQPLGRIWNVGPQKTLYVPGPFLHSGANDVIVFDLLASRAVLLLAGISLSLIHRQQSSPFLRLQSLPQGLFGRVAAHFPAQCYDSDSINPTGPNRPRIGIPWRIARRRPLLTCRKSRTMWMA